MSFKEELMYDFAETISRVMVCGRLTVIDSVKKLELLSDSQIVVRSGKRFVAISGEKLVIKELADERMLIDGEIKEIQFYGSQDQY